MAMIYIMTAHLQNWPFTDGLTQLKCRVPMRESFKVVFHMQHRFWLLSQSYTITIILIFCRLKLEERRKTLVKKLEETTQLTTYLHLQLKRWAWVLCAVCVLLVLQDRYLILNTAILFWMRFCGVLHSVTQKCVVWLLWNIWLPIAFFRSAPRDGIATMGPLRFKPHLPCLSHISTASWSRVRKAQGNL